jgi:hypothetical protein
MWQPEVMRKTTVYLSDDLKLRLKRVAGDRGVSESEVVRAAIDEYTRTHARPRLPLFSIGEFEPITDWDEAMRGFGEH